VDRPDEVRRIVNFKRLQLTDFKIDIPRVAKKKVLAAALEESGGHSLSPPAARGFSKATSTFFACTDIWPDLLTSDWGNSCHHLHARPTSLMEPEACTRLRLTRRAPVWCAEVFSKFENSAWGKKLAKRALKTTQTDFDRYQAAVARKKKSSAVKKVFDKLKSSE
jgi:ribosomal protein L14E/L6E/L27E